MQPEPENQKHKDGLPSHPLDKRWYLHIDGEIKGPFTGHQIKEMVLQDEVLPNDLAYPEDGSDWVQLSSDGILSTLFRSVEIPRPSNAVRASKPRRYFWAALPLALVIAALWIAWPFYAVYDLTQGVRKGDLATLESRVAWDSVRRGLRNDLSAILMQTLSKEEKSSRNIFGAALANLLGPAIVDRIVENFVTPQAFVVAANSKNKKNSEVEATTENNVVSTARRLNWNHVQYAFFSGSPFAFRVDVLPEKNFPFSKPIQFQFEWAGSWRLTRIILPADTIDVLSDPKKNKLLDYDKQFTELLSGKKENRKSPAAEENLNKELEDLFSEKKENEKKAAANSDQETIGVTLVSKGFRAANIRQGEYQDLIVLELFIANQLADDVRAFDGVLQFTDLLDNEIMSIKLTINEPLKAKASMKWKGSVDYNQFRDGDRKLRNEQTANIKIRFSPRKVLFADGSTKEFQ